MDFAGKDGTDAFMRQQHSQEAVKIKNGYYIGDLEAGSNPIIMIVLLAIVLGLGYYFLI